MLSKDIGVCLLRLPLPPGYGEMRPHPPLPFCAHGQMRPGESHASRVRVPQIFVGLKQDECEQNTRLVYVHCALCTMF